MMSWKTRPGLRGRVAVALVLSGAILAATVAGVAATGAAQGGATTSAAPTQTDPVAVANGGAGAEAKALCQTYQSTLASGVGVSTDKLQQAQLGAVDATIDKAVADGLVTAARGAQLKANVPAADEPICDLIPGLRSALRHPILDPLELLDTAAATLHTDRATLVAELRALQPGQSLKTVAAKHNVPYDTLKAALHASAQAQLSAAVKNQRITQTAADKILAAFDKALDQGRLLPRRVAHG